MTTQTYPSLQFVDSPSTSAAVLFDFNDKTASVKRYPLKDSLSLGAPDIDGDVDAIDPRYLPRTVAFTVRIDGTKSAAISLQSTIARQVLYGPGWLRFQLSASSKVVFFRTYRAVPGELEFTVAAASTTTDVWDLAVSFPAEPFAWGERVTQTLVTVTNDPVSGGTNKMTWALPAIQGDAPVPLRFYVATTTPNTAIPNYLLNVHASATAHTNVQIPVGTTSGTPDGLTAGTDTSASTVGATNYVGGSYRRVSFATNTGLVSRLSGTGPAVAPGTYKVMVRLVNVVNTAGRIRFRSYLASNTVTFVGTGSSDGCWVDLGEVALPPQRPLFAADQGPAATFPINLDISRTSGSGTVDIDHITLIPVAVADTFVSRTLRVNPNVNFVAGQTNYWDGDTEQAWMVNPSTGALVAPVNSQSNVQGVFPVAIPGAAHTATLYVAANAGGSGDDNTFNNQVTVSYCPRFLYVGDS